MEWILADKHLRTVMERVSDTSKAGRTSVPKSSLESTHGEEAMAGVGE